MPSASLSPRPRVAVLTLGCARNEVDSEELAARLDEGGYALADDPADADAVLVNTCGFVEAAKRDSVDALLAAGDGGAKVVAVGCLAERYGDQLASELPEADAVLSFDDYAGIADRVADVLAGRAHRAHTPRDRRALLPLTPVARGAAAGDVPGHGRTAAPDVPVRDLPDLDAARTPASGPVLATAPLRRRLTTGPTAPLKLASGCDRRCAFCAIPSFRGAFVSRRPHEVLDEARWLAAQGVREVVLVSENSTSYGKDLGDPRLLETLLPELGAVEGLARVRLSYLQPAEVRPGLVRVLAGTPGVAPYFDLSFQHASGPVLRRMRRFGDRERFLALLASVRELAPDAGVRSNVIVGFPGETDDDVAELEAFLEEARLDAVGVFGYSDEDGTEAAGLPDHVDPDEVGARVARVSALVEELMAQRAEERVGEVVEVLVEEVDADGAEGRAAHQAPEVDGTVRLPGVRPSVGTVLLARVDAAEGVDLVATPLASADAAP